MEWDSGNLGQESFTRYSVCVFAVFEHERVFHLRVERELKCKSLENFSGLGKQLALLEAGEVSYLLSQLS